MISNTNATADIVFEDLIRLPGWTKVDHSFDSVYATYLQARATPFSYENNLAYLKQETRLSASSFNSGEFLATVVSKSVDSNFLFMLPPLGLWSSFLKKVEELCAQICRHTGRRLVLKKFSDPEHFELMKLSLFRYMKLEDYKDPRDFPEDLFPQIVIDNDQTRKLEGTFFQKIRNHIYYLKRNQVAYTRNLTGSLAEDIHKLTVAWADQHARRMLEKGLGGDTNVDHTAYTAISENFSHLIDDDEYFGRVLFLNNMPCGYTLAGRTASNTAALYASLCMVDMRGASELLLMDTIGKLSDEGVRYLNMGGAETDSLFRYKSKFKAAIERKTYELEYAP